MCSNQSGRREARFTKADQIVARVVQHVNKWPGTRKPCPSPSVLLPSITVTLWFYFYPQSILLIEGQFKLRSSLRNLELFGAKSMLYSLLLPKSFEVQQHERKRYVYFFFNQGELEATCQGTPETLFQRNRHDFQNSVKSEGKKDFVSAKQILSYGPEILANIIFCLKKMSPTHKNNK